MAKTTGSSSGHRPTQLAVDGQDAKRRVQSRIDAAQTLLRGKTAATSAGVDAFSAKVRNWVSTTRSLLMRLFDSPEYATNFERECRRFPVGAGSPSALERLTDALEILKSGRQNLVGLLETIDVIVELAADDVRTPAPVAPVSRAPVHIHMRDVYGTVQVDSLANSIESHVSLGLDAAAVTEAFRVMTEALRADTALDDSVRSEALQYLDYLSEASAAEPEKRRPALIAAAVTWINGALTVATKAGQVWQEYGPTIEHGLRTIGL